MCFGVGGMGVRVVRGGGWVWGGFVGIMEDDDDDDDVFVYVG